MDSSSLNTARLQSLLEEEKNKAMANEMVAKITDICWDKCITGGIGSSISHSENACLTNCARRYIDMSMLTVQLFRRLQ